MNRPVRLLFLVNDLFFLLSHRLPIARSAQDAGYEVHLAADWPIDSREADERVQKLRAQGFRVHHLPMDRSRFHPLRELLCWLRILRLFVSIRPRLVHLVTIKPVLYGGLAARLTRIPGTVSAISGLGYIFTSKGVASAIRRALVRLAYRLALKRKGSLVIFQNEEDQRLFVEGGLIAARQARMIRGSGVDLNEFIPLPEPEDEGSPVVLFPARLLKDKGLIEFYRAAGEVKAKRPEIRFALVGSIDPGNPASLDRLTLDQWVASGHIEWWGHFKDIREAFSKAQVICLPSYREGLPKVLIEAAACGRAMVTTDVPGCRDVVLDGVNGLLVPAEDSSALGHAILRLFDHPELRKKMALEGRKRAEENFGIERVIELTQAIYRELSVPDPASRRASKLNSVPSGQQ